MSDFTTEDFSISDIGGQVLARLAALEGGAGGSVTAASIGLGLVNNTPDSAKPVSTAQAAAINAKISKNAAITPGSKTKVTFDASGLVTGGTDATTADVNDSLNRRYVTDSEKTAIGTIGSGGGGGGSSLALGEAAGNAYYGDKGKAAYDHSLILTGNPHGTTSAQIAEDINLYFTEGRVRSAILTGLGTGSNSAIAGADSVITAFAKLQTQINNVVASGGAAVSSVNGRAGTVVLNKSDIGLPAVPNTDATQRGSHFGTQGLSTISGITSSRLLGRNSAGFGAAEEISIGANLTLLNNILSASGGGGTTETFTTLKSKLGFTTRHLSEFASMSAAITAIGSTPCELVVDSSVTISANMATHTNTLVTMRGDGFFYVNSGYTLTINRMSHVGNWQVFGGAGNVIFGTGAVKEINPVWYSGYAYGVDITHGMQNAITSCTNNGGGKIYIPGGSFTTSASVSPQNGTHISGSNASGGGSSPTVIAPTGAFPVFLLNKAGFLSDVTIKDINVDCTNQPNAGGILTSKTEGACYRTHLENVVILGGLYGYKVNAPSGGFENIQAKIDHCSFLGSRVGFHCNTYNSGFVFSNCYFVIPTIVSGYSTGGRAHELISVGTVVFNDCLVVGNSVHADNTPVTDGSCITYTQDAFNKIVYNGMQDENVQFAHKTGGNYYPAYPIVYRDCGVQSDFSPSSEIEYTFDNSKFLRYESPRFVDNANRITINLIGRNTMIYRHLVSGTYVDSADDFYNFCNFTSYYTRVKNQDGSINKIARTAAGVSATQIFECSKGTINVSAGSNTVSFYNYLVNANSYARAWVVGRGSDTSNGTVTETKCTDLVVRIQTSAAVTSEVVVFWEIVVDKYEGTGL